MNKRNSSTEPAPQLYTPLTVPPPPPLTVPRPPLIVPPPPTVPPPPPLTVPAKTQIGVDYEQPEMETISRPGSPTYSDISSPPGSPSLPEIGDLVEYLNQQMPENPTFIAKITSSLQNIQVLSDVCVANLERLNNSIPSIPTETGLEREPNDGNIDPDPIEFAINVIIIVLTYLPFLICQSIQIINYTIGSLFNVATFGTFNDDDPLNKRVFTISSAIFSLLFVKITTILDNIFRNMYSGRLAWTYSYRFSTSFFIVSFFMYCLGFFQSTLNAGFSSGVIDLFFKIIIAFSEYLPEPFHSLWRFPIDCGVNGIICVIPYYFRETAYQPIQYFKDKVTEYKGRFKAISEEASNTTQYIWNETTIGVAGVLNIIPNTTQYLKEHITEHPDIISDTIHTVTESNRKSIQDTTSRGLESVVDVASIVIKQGLSSVDKAYFKSIEMLILSQYPILKDDLEEYTIDELIELLQDLQTEITITDTGVEHTYNQSDPFSGPENRFVRVTGTDIPTGYVPIPDNNNIMYDTITDNEGETIIRNPRSNEKKRPWGLRPAINIANDDVEIPSLDDNIRRITNRPISNLPDRETPKQSIHNLARNNLPQGRSISSINVRESITKLFSPMDKGRPVKTIQKPINLQQSIIEPDEEKSSELVPFETNREVTNPYAFYFNAQVTNLNMYIEIPKISKMVANIVENIKNDARINMNNAVINLGPSLEASSDSLTSYLKWLNSADSITSRRVLSDMFSNVLTDTGDVVINVLAHSTVEFVKDSTVNQVSTYIVTPSVNTIMSAFLGMIMFFRGRGGRAVARRGGRHKKSMKRRSRNKKSTKKHRKHKKSTKKHRKHKKSTRK